MKEEKLEQEHDAPTNGSTEWDGEAVIELIWTDFQGRVDRSDIRQVVLGIMREYENVRITTYVPIFVRRKAVAALRAGLAYATPDGPVQVYSTTES